MNSAIFSKISFRSVSSLLAAAALVVCASAAHAQKNPDALYGASSITLNAAATPDQTKVAVAIKADGVAVTLTACAETGSQDAATCSPADSKMANGQQKRLSQVLAFHVFGRSNGAKELVTMVEQGTGKLLLKTTQNGTLTATPKDGQIMLTDAKGEIAMVNVDHVFESKGTILLLPN
jgi:hypothetical protein